ncbi:metallophosphoesterase [Bacillus sp. 1P06AnD]|uniref:metallophosphoesterase n=1 Tax=Bacillus sp. 1P06AnD TaxID=3132208 RepID=UPI0039A36E47
MIVKKCFKGIAYGVLFVFCLFFYAYQIEPNLFEVKTVPIKTEYIPKSFEKLRIVHFSDTHLGDHFTTRDFNKAAKQINALKPDLIAFTGDFFNHFASYHSSQKKEAQRILDSLKAKYGKFAVFGNHDRGGGAGTQYESFMEDAGFNVLVNETITLISREGERITITGLDDYLLGTPLAEKTLAKIKEEDFNLLLVHEPDTALDFKLYPLDLQLSGHSHGGQVQIPFKGAIILPPLAEHYREGLYEQMGAAKKMHVYVNRGMGTSRIPFRFLSKPELTLIILESYCN